MGGFKNCIVEDGYTENEVRNKGNCDRVTFTATKVVEPVTRISSHHVLATPSNAQLQSS